MSTHLGLLEPPMEGATPTKMTAYEAALETHTDMVLVIAKWENDDYVCRGHILNGMSDHLFNVYLSVDSTKGLWEELEAKYMAKDASLRKILVSFFNSYRMVEG